MVSPVHKGISGVRRFAFRTLKSPGSRVRCAQFVRTPEMVRATGGRYWPLPPGSGLGCDGDARAGIDGELEPPRGQQDRGDEEGQDECGHRDPAQQLEALVANGRRAEEGRDDRVRRQQCAGALPDARDERVLICECGAPGLVRDLLDSWQVPTAGSHGGQCRGLERARHNRRPCPFRRPSITGGRHPLADPRSTTSTCGKGADMRRRASSATEDERRGWWPVGAPSRCPFASRARATARLLDLARSDSGCVRAVLAVGGGFRPWRHVDV